MVGQAEALIVGYEGEGILVRFSSPTAPLSGGNVTYNREVGTGMLFPKKSGLVSGGELKISLCGCLKARCHGRVPVAIGGVHDLED